MMELWGWPTGGTADPSPRRVPHGPVRLRGGSPHATWLSPGHTGPSEFDMQSYTHDTNTRSCRPGRLAISAGGAASHDLEPTDAPSAAVWVSRRNHCAARS